MHWTRLLVAMLGLGLLLNAAATPPPLRVDAETRQVSLSEHAEYLHDQTGHRGLDEIRASQGRGEMQPQAGRKPNFGYLDGALWLHFQVDHSAPGTSDWLLVLEYSLLDHIELFRIDPLGRQQYWLSGDRTPFATRSVPMRYLNLAQSLDLPGRYDFYLRVTSESSMQVPLVWTRTDTYLQGDARSLLGLGAYFGVLLALFAYNLILYLSVRDRSFLYYVVYVATTGLLLVAITGLGFQHLWPTSPDWGNLVVLLAMTGMLAAMLQFTRRFLDLRQTLPRGDRVLRALMLIGLALGCSSLWLPYGTVVRAATWMVFPAALAIYACGLAVRQQFPPARYFLIAWTALLAGILVYASVALGLLPKTFATEYSIEFGSAAEMVLLSFALAYRINVLTAANARMQREVRDQLEARVRERTADLNATLSSLEDANRRLEDFSRRDGLTGAFNRRSFEHMLQRAEHELRERGTSYSVIMIDVDHFKQVNDHHGHLVGDDCLRHIANLLEQTVTASSGQLARYGGEEFAVVVASGQAQDVHALAERCRRMIESKPFVSNGRTIPLSISLGIAVRTSDTPDGPTDLVRAADDALYLAKESGRNCTRTANPAADV